MKRSNTLSSPQTRTLALPRIPTSVCVVVLLCVFAACWLPVLNATSLAPPVDNIEELVWLRTLDWGYYKHPPLPTALAWLIAQAAGASAWTTYLLGAVITLTAMWLLWTLLRELRGVRYATISLAAALCITFYNGRLYYYNHNVVLLLLSTATAMLTWRAFTKRQLRWWFWIGMTVGLGALTKYQVAVTLASLACFWVSQRAWRDDVHRLGALLAALVALTIFLPHVIWLRTHDFGPVNYALESSLGVDLPAGARALSTLNWIADELLNRAVPAFLLLGLVLYVSTRRFRASPAVQFQGVSRAQSTSSLGLLLCWGLVPLAFMALVAMLFGAQLQLEWGTPFLLFVVPCAMELRPRARWDAASHRSLAAIFIVIQALLVTINIATSPIGLHRFADTHWRSFPAHHLALRIATEARLRLHGPVAVVIGSVGEAGALSLELPEHPVVLIDGRYDRSPWLTPELVAACGALDLTHSVVRSHDGARTGTPLPDFEWRVVPPLSSVNLCRKQAERVSSR